MTTSRRDLLKTAGGSCRRSFAVWLPLEESPVFNIPKSERI